MLKPQRLQTIQQLVAHRGSASVTELSTQLGCSEMTIRRDLAALAQAKKVVRVHGGAQTFAYRENNELSRNEKRNLHVREKKQVARAAASLVRAGDVVYIGPGTTNELIANYLPTLPDLRIITSSLPVFQSLQDRAAQLSLQLIGGEYRAKTGVFIGSLVYEMLQRLHTDKAIISVNSLAGPNMANANPDEGELMRIALTNADKKYAVLDHSKLDKRDFYTFYSLSDCDALITDPWISQKGLTEYSHYTRVITTPLN